MQKYIHPYWFDRRWLIMFYLPIALIYAASEGIGLTAVLVICTSLFLLPFYVWFGHVAQCLEITPDRIIARTYKKKTVELSWEEIKEVRKESYRWFSFFNYIVVEPMNTAAAPILYSEAIEKYPELTRIICEKVGPARCKLTGQR